MLQTCLAVPEGKFMSEIKSESITLVGIDSIIPNPKNANRHSIEQIKRLEKLITYQGFRNPLIVSNRTGFLIVGHGRLEAAINLGLEKLPVIYQDFKDEAQEYSYLVSDNEIARWSELDLHSVHLEIESLEISDEHLLGIEFDIKNFEVIKPELNGATPEEKLEKYLDKEFLEIKLEYNREDYDKVIGALETYRALNGAATYPQIIWELLGIEE